MNRAESAARVLITLVVGGIGAAVGFTHTHDWAVKNGQHGWISWGVAIVVECMAVVAALEIRRMPGPFPVVVLVASFLLQMAAQVSAAPPSVEGWLLAATPALGFLVIVKLIMRRATTSPSPAEQDQDHPTAPAPMTATATVIREVIPTETQEPIRQIERAPLQPASWPPK
jgi:hypothetical protein